jgi:hypothetical protein
VKNLLHDRLLIRTILQYLSYPRAECVRTAGCDALPFAVSAR